jgi:CheY-like chemotaxis protein
LIFGQGIAKNACIVKYRVLLVEDNPDNQLVTRLMLESLGHPVEWVSDAESALQKLSERPYDVVFLDLVLPGIDGFEFVRRLRRRIADPERPWVVALTAHTMEVDETMCRSAGANDFLSKPLSLEGLARALAQAPEPSELASDKTEDRID